MVINLLEKKLTDWLIWPGWPWGPDKRILLAGLWLSCWLDWGCVWAGACCWGCCWACCWGCCAFCRLFSDFSSWSSSVRNSLFGYGIGHPKIQFETPFWRNWSKFVEKVTHKFVFIGFVMNSGISQTTNFVPLRRTYFGLVEFEFSWSKIWCSKKFERYSTRIYWNTIQNKLYKQSEMTLIT